MTLTRNKKILLGVVGIVIVGVGLYLRGLKSLAKSGNVLFAMRCSKVNPELIAYKGAFLKFADAIQHPANYADGSATEYYGDYISHMRNYVQAETEWLDLQAEYLASAGFHNFAPWYIRQAGEYQLGMYSMYRDEAKHMLMVLDQEEDQSAGLAKAGEARERRIEFENKYADMFTNAAQIGDWRGYIFREPLPTECTPENMQVPDTAGSIDWENTGEETPSPLPIDSEYAS